MARQEVYGIEARLDDVDPNDERYKTALEKYKAQCNGEKEKVLAAGGLHILGTERHEARRIDNQLRGRSGRQGDPGSSRFYMSLEDDLLRIFGAERISGLMERLGLEEDVPIEHGLVSRAIENAQKKVEGHNFDIRKHLLEYDDVMNQQRKTIYGLRRAILEGRYELDKDAVGDGKVSKARLEEMKEEAAARQEELKKQQGGLADRLRPHIVQIVDGMFAAQAQPQPGAATAGGDGAGTENGHNPDGSPYRAKPAIDGRALKHEIYRRFGAVVDFDGLEADRLGIIGKACDHVAWSLVQQRERILDLTDGIVGGLVEHHCGPKQHAEDWDLAGLSESVSEVFNYKVSLDGATNSPEAMAERIWKEVSTFMEAREQEVGPIAFLYIARHYYLEEIDQQWIDHLKTMDHLREGIGLRGYGQRDPKQEYKKEGFNYFSSMMERIDQNVAKKLFRVQVNREEEVYNVKHKQRKIVMQSGGGSPAEAEKQAAEAQTASKTVRNEGPRIGRNDPCPCGSGKKYKKCHLGKESELPSGAMSA
jgi:preprotein translocase subunit SecA